MLLTQWTALRWCVKNQAVGSTMPSQAKKQGGLENDVDTRLLRKIVTDHHLLGSYSGCDGAPCLYC